MTKRYTVALTLPELRAAQEACAFYFGSAKTTLNPLPAQVRACGVFIRAIEEADGTNQPHNRGGE